jgi:hypothetical protein
VVGLAIASACLIAALVIASLIEFDSPRLGRAVLERVSAASGAKITARAFRFRLASGLVLRDVDVSAALPGGRAHLTMQELVFEHRLLPLLRKEVAVRRIVLRRPRIELVEGGAAPVARAPAAAPSTAALALSITEMSIVDGSGELRAAGEPKPTTFSGLNLALRELRLNPKAASLGAGLSAQGQLRIASVGMTATRIQDFQAPLQIVDGRVSVEPRFRTDEGTFRGEITARLDRLPMTYTVALDGDPLDVNAVTAAGKDAGFGPGTLKLKGRGRGSEVTGFTGDGTLGLATGRLPSTPVLSALEALLGRTHLVGARYKATQAPFRVEGGRVIIEDFRIDAGDVLLRVDGWSSLEGPVDLRLAVGTPRAGLSIREVPDSVLDALTDDNGRVVIPFRVTGTQTRPRVFPDSAALMAQAKQGGIRAATEKAKDGLLGLFRKKKE